VLSSGRLETPSDFGRFSDWRYPTENRLGIKNQSNDNTKFAINSLLKSGTLWRTKLAPQKTTAIASAEINSKPENAPMMKLPCRQIGQWMRRRYRLAEAATVNAAP